MVYCVAFGCNNNSKVKKPGITFHRFPKNKQRCKTWVDAVRRKDWNPLPTSCLCSEHFSEKFIDRTSLSVIRLRDNAIPSIFQHYVDKPENMAGCCAFGCSNSSKKGFLMKRMPSDPERRKKWIAKVRRKYWTPSNSSYLCEAHFTPDQFEQNRADGRRMLKSNAIPTIFSYQQPKKKFQRRPPFKPDFVPNVDLVLTKRPQHNFVSTEPQPEYNLVSTEQPEYDLVSTELQREYKLVSTDNIVSTEPQLEYNLVSNEQPEYDLVSTDLKLEYSLASTEQLEYDLISTEHDLVSTEQPELVLIEPQPEHDLVPISSSSIKNDNLPKLDLSHICEIQFAHEIDIIEENGVLEYDKVLEYDEVLQDNEVLEDNQVLVDNKFLEVNEVLVDNEVLEYNEVLVDNEVLEYNEVLENNEVIEENISILPSLISTPKCIKTILPIPQQPQVQVIRLPSPTKEYLKERILKYSKAYDKLIRLHKNLKNKLKKLRKTKETNYSKCLKKVFNQNQIVALLKNSGGKTKWNDDTIKKALNLKSACGSKGYKELLLQNYPFPSLRTLRKRVKKIPSEPISKPITYLNPTYKHIDLNKSELNTLYCIAGYIVTNIKKKNDCCYMCIATLGGYSPYGLEYEKLTQLKNFKQKSLFFCNEKTFNFFLKMEEIFMNNIINNTKLSNLKEFLVNIILPIEENHIGICHDIKSHLINKYVMFRIKVNSMDKKKLTTFSYKLLNKYNFMLL